MISTDERSPSGGDNSTTRLSSSHSHHNHHQHHNNNNNEDNSLYYRYIPPASQSLPIIHLPESPTSSPPSSPFLRHSLPDTHRNQIVLRDPPPASFIEHYSPAVRSLPRSSSTSGLAEFIQHHLSSRLIPKLGSIVKRFNLNYSGEGLVTDRQRTRTVRVGIRFQVQVDSFVNNRLEQERPRAIQRTQSAPTVEQLDSGFSSPTEIFPQNNRQLAALEYQTDKCSNNFNTSSTSSASSIVAEEGASSSLGRSSNSSGGIIIGGDSCSSGISTESSSPVLNRRQPTTSTTLAFHNRINQALLSYRKTQLGSSPPAESSSGRRSSVHRKGSSTPPQGARSESDSYRGSGSGASNMEDSSSYQVLRHFPGSNVHSLNELNWETAAFEKEIRDKLQWIGEKINSLRVPRAIKQLIDFGRDYAKENPVTALILLALFVTSSLPVLLFLVFAVATILVTFVGFLFVEGTLLTVATVIFGGVVVIVGFGTLTAVLLGMLGYFATNQTYLVLTGQSKIYKLLRKLPIIGRFFPEPRERKSSYADQTEDDEQISKLIKIAVNGKANGFGPKQEHYSYDDLLDTEEEEEDEEDTAVVNGGGTSDSDLGLDNSVEEDLGNQEVILENGAPKEENGMKNSVNGTSSSPNSPVNGENESSPPPPYVNGHGKKNKNAEVEVDSEISE